MSSKTGHGGRGERIPIAAVVPDDMPGYFRNVLPAGVVVDAAEGIVPTIRGFSKAVDPRVAGSVPGVRLGTHF